MGCCGYGRNRQFDYDLFDIGMDAIAPFLARWGAISCKQPLAFLVLLRAGRADRYCAPRVVRFSDRGTDGVVDIS